MTSRSIGQHLIRLRAALADRHGMHLIRVHIGLEDRSPALERLAAGLARRIRPNVP